MIVLPGSSLQETPTNMKFIPIKDIFSDSQSTAQSKSQNSFVDTIMDSRLTARSGPLTARELRLMQRNWRKEQMEAARKNKSSRNNNTHNNNMNNNKNKMSNKSKAKGKSNKTRNNKRSKSKSKVYNINSNTDNRDKKSEGVASSGSISGQHIKHRRQRLPTTMELYLPNHSQSNEYATLSSRDAKSNRNGFQSIAASNYSKPTTGDNDNNQNNNRNTNNKTNPNTSNNNSSNSNKTKEKKNNETQNANQKQRNNNDEKVEKQEAKQGSNLHKFTAFSDD